jgi:hypothetical protein
MKSRSSHISDNDLLLLVDRELSARRTASLRAHLAVCLECEGRLSRIRSNLAEISTTYHDARPEISDAFGPRALLRARLLQDIERNGPADTRWLRAIPTARSLAFVCVLVLLTAIAFQALHRQQRRETLAEAGPLPNPTFTPGSTRQVNLADLCAMDREEVVRSVPASVERQVFEEYGIAHLAAADFEVDYLITPGLGGSDDVKNLWPEPHSNTVWNSYVKDQLEDRLHRMVCERQIPLEQAQRDIAGNWISAYKKYFQTDHPLAEARPNSATEVASLR